MKVTFHLRSGDRVTIRRVKHLETKRDTVKDKFTSWTITYGRVPPWRRVHSINPGDIAAITTSGFRR